MQKSSSTWPFVDSSCVNAWTRRASAALLALVVLAPTAALADPGRTFATPPPRVDLTPDPVECTTSGRPRRTAARAASAAPGPAPREGLARDEDRRQGRPPRPLPRREGLPRRRHRRTERSGPRASEASSAGMVASSPRSRRSAPATTSRSASSTAPWSRRRSATTIAPGTSRCSSRKPANGRTASSPRRASPFARRLRSRASPSSTTSRR